ncbi:rhodanese-like domain-containing protein [Candidatus Peregrinibacteria bacterium]|nr:rhodanese-like domain-containing protein [Candidatus Peregrinibacteria bacterium]
MINQDQLLSKYDDKTHNYFLLDVRTTYEFEHHHIPGSINIPIDNLEARIKEVPVDKHIITICEHGIRSSAAEQFLIKQGYQADSLEHGLSVWSGQLNRGK